MPALTDEHLQIPRATALWFWARRKITCRALGIDLDELTGIAGLALTEAAANYDLERSPTGEEHYGAYLVQQTRWRLNTEVRNRTLSGRSPEKPPASLDADMSEDFTLADTLATIDPHLASVEARELAELALSRMSPADREAARCVWLEGYDLARVSQHLGLSQQVVSLRLVKARERLARVPELRRFAREYQR